MTVGYRSTNKTVYSAKSHNTAPQGQRYRRRLLTGRVETRLKQIVAQVVDEAGGQVIEVEVNCSAGATVHLLVEVPPTVALSKLVQSLKGRSSRVLRSELPALRRARALWSPSWFVSTVGGAPLEVVRRYVEKHRSAGEAA
ncbi:MAG: IS200/IS605 family transposase [Acidimicrobiales bacterium]